MNRRYFQYFTIPVLIAAMLACTLFEDIAAGSGTWYVATTGDDSNDCLSAASACRTIQAAIDKATAGGNIQIADGTYAERVRVNKNLRIFGASEAGTIIDAGGSGAALTIALEGDPGTETLTVLISKLTIQNGSADRGAGVYIAGHALATLVLMRISNNTARIGGGLANDGEARISHVRIVSNHATERCGGVDNTGTFDMYRGEVSENSTDGHGGGLCNNAVGHLTIRRAEILGNDATIFSNIGAGGIYNLGRLGVYVSLIDGNHARGNGGGIFDAGAATNINGVTISNNDTAQEGAGVFTCSGHILNSTISGNVGNSAVFAQFGGSFETGPRECRHDNVFLLSNSTISGNDFIGLSVEGNHRLESSTIAYNLYGLSVSGFVIDTPQENWYIKNMLIAYNPAGDCINPPPFLPSAGHNLDTDGTCNWSATGDLSDEDPSLEALSDNGGGTWTHALLGPWDSNPAVDNGGSDCPALDQRGVTRPQELDGDGVPECDIGAVEEEEFGRLVVPLEEATPTPVPSPEPASLKFTKNAFCRKGPGVNYDDVTAIAEGQTAAAEGRNQDGTWYFIQPPDGKSRCWVSNTTVEVTGPVDQLVIMPALPLPEPADQFMVKNRVCTPNGFKLSLSWTYSAADISGFRLYRNGDLIATLNSNKSGYDDSPPMNEPLLYELAAYNENGSSEHLLLEDQGCT